jgi:lipopolysaccharide export LptBFGC system permease protein LptF
VTADSARWTNGYWKHTNGIERLFRAGDDALPAEKTKSIFTAAEMDGPPEAVARWNATPLVVSNVVVALTNLSHSDDATQRQWTAASFTLTNDLLEGLRFREPLGAGASRRLIADAGVWTNGHWRFVNTREFLYRSATDSDVLESFYPELDLPEFDESPDMIRSEVRISELLSRNTVMRRAELPVRDVLDYLRLHPNLSQADTARLTTQLHARIAAPWTCLVVVFIAIPFGSGSGRRNIFYGVAGSLALGFLFFTVQRLGFALGQSGIVPGWVGAWLPNVSFAVTGIWLITRVR